MAKIRAYKIAEELGMEKAELVERAKSLGIDVPSPMASLDEDVAAALREKLGGHAPGAHDVERRVDGQSGSAVTPAAASCSSGIIGAWGESQAPTPRDLPRRSSNFRIG